ncbi:MAG: dCTP deaminase [Candidatus Dojkabacteria bacterium]
MIFSDADIKKNIELGIIEISPFDINCLGPASYKFNLGDKLLVPGDIDVIDFKKKTLPDYKLIDIPEDGYRLKTNEFILAQTKEVITLADDIAMTIEGRSTFARMGIEVTMTSTFIEPDHSNSIITMELKNNGNNAVQLYSGMPLFKGIFHRLISKTNPEIGPDSTYSSTKPQTLPLAPNL